MTMQDAGTPARPDVSLNYYSWTQQKRHDSWKVFTAQHVLQVSCLHEGR